MEKLFKWKNQLNRKIEQTFFVFARVLTQII